VRLPRWSVLYRIAIGRRKGAGYRGAEPVAPAWSPFQCICLIILANGYWPAESGGTRNAYQRSRRGPMSAPAPAARTIPRLYQVSTKIADASGQCRQYSVAAQAPAARPAIAPAARRRVGASLRNDQTRPAKIGAARLSTSQGQIIQLRPNHKASHRSEGVRASSPIPIVARTSTGSISDHRPWREPGSGLASRVTA